MTAAIIAATTDPTTIPVPATAAPGSGRGDPRDSLPPLPDRGGSALEIAPELRKIIEDIVFWVALEVFSRTSPNDRRFPKSITHLLVRHYSDVTRCANLFGCASCIRHREWKDTSAGETQVWLGLVAGRPREVLGAGEFIVMGDLIVPRG
jgi:hypothetical protein